MPFVIQPNNVQSCGAYCVAYYRWLRFMGNPGMQFNVPFNGLDAAPVAVAPMAVGPMAAGPMAAGPILGNQADVAQLYGQIQFNQHYINFPPGFDPLQPLINQVGIYSSPILMLPFLASHGVVPTLYHCNDPVPGFNHIVAAARGMINGLFEVLQGLGLFGGLGVNAAPAPMANPVAQDSYRIGIFCMQGAINVGLHYVLLHRDGVGQLRYYNPWDGIANPNIAAGLMATGSGIIIN